MSVEKTALTVGQSRAVGGLAGGLAGSLAGAGLHKKDRKKGAIAGGVSGALLGSMMTPAILRRTSWARPGNISSYAQSLDNVSASHASLNGAAVSGRAAVNGLKPVHGEGVEHTIKGVRVKVYGQGREQTALVYPNELDTAGRAAPVRVSKRVAFGTTPEEFAGEAAEYAARQAPHGRTFGKQASAILQAFFREIEKIAALPGSKESLKAQKNIDRFYTATDTKQKWDDFRKNVSRKSFAQNLQSDPRVDDKLALHTDSMNRLDTGKVVGAVGEYKIKRLRGSTELGCTCNDWRFKKSVAPMGERECKHIKQFLGAKN